MRSVLLLLMAANAGLLFSQPLSLNLQITNTNCQGAAGAAEATVSGGTAPYLYEWSNGTTASTVSGLSAGTYSVTVFSAGKTDSIARSFTVTDSATIRFNVLPNDTVCSGKKVEITASATPAGGAFQWSDGDLQTVRNGDSINVFPLADQVYTVRYTHPTCPGRATVRIESGAVKASLGGLVQPSCGLANGSIIGAGTGYKPLFSWLKDGQPLSTAASVLSNLSSGNYTFILRDEIAGCSDTIKDIILQDVTSFATVSSIQITDDKCLDAKGSATINVSGGSGSFNYRWSHNNALNANTATNLAKGSYTITINDGVCTPFDTTIQVGGPSSSVSVSVSGTDDNCTSSTGTATAVAAGGNPAYSFEWSSGAKTAVAQNLLGSNTYEVTVTDAEGCSATASVSIGDIPSPSLVFNPFDSICPGAANGVLQLVAGGGLPPYAFAWSHNAQLSSSTATGLTPGSYTATVTDAGGCTAVAQAFIAAFDNPQIDLGADKNIIKGETAELNVKTSLPVTAVQWSPFIQSAENNLTAYVKPDDTTTYFVTVSYGKGCSIQDNITVNVTDVPTVLDIPNIFTPNNDGVNDFFYVTATAIEKLTIKIFDRWGNKVFESNAIDFMWNGINQFTGLDSPNGVYTYSLVYNAFNSAQEKIAKGAVTLVR